jgi:hypothetical protein
MELNGYQNDLRINNMYLLASNCKPVNPLFLLCLFLVFSFAPTHASSQEMYNPFIGSWVRKEVRCKKQDGTNTRLKIETFPNQSNLWIYNGNYQTSVPTPCGSPTSIGSYKVISTSPWELVFEKKSETHCLNWSNSRGDEKISYIYEREGINLIETIIEKTQICDGYIQFVYQPLTT